MDWPETYKRLQRRSFAILFLMAVLSAFFRSFSLSLGIVMGGLVAIANFGFLQRNVRAAFPGSNPEKVNRALVVAKIYLRLLLLGAAVVFLLRWERINAAGLILGLSTVVFSIVAFGVRNAFNSASEEAK